MLYRLYVGHTTKNKKALPFTRTLQAIREGIARILPDLAGYTMRSETGVWKGELEEVTVIDIASDPIPLRIAQLASHLAYVLEQSSVLITGFTGVEFIYAEPIEFRGRNIPRLANDARAGNTESK